MLKIDRAPATSGISAEAALIGVEEARSRTTGLATMRDAIARLGERAQLVADLMVEQGMSQPDDAGHLDVSRTRVSQLVRELKTAVFKAMEQPWFNTSDVLGSGVKEPVGGAGHQHKKGR